MKILKGIGIFFGGLFALIGVFMAVTYASDPIKFGRFYSALVNFPILSTYEEWWTPKATVKGIENAQPVPIASADERTISEEAWNAVVDWNESRNPIGLVVVHKGKIQYEKYWPGYDAETMNDTASMHKSITGVMFGFALRDGDIKSIDEPVKNYLPEWKDDPRGDITIRQFLNMSTGLKIDPFSMNPFSRTAELFYGGDIRQVALATEREQEPGIEFQYSSINSQILGVILERATGKKLNEYESEHVWQPLGAKDAYLVLDSEESNMARTFCCFRTPPREWARLGIMLANGGKANGKQIIPEGWMEEWLEPAPLMREYGKQVWLGSDLVGTRLYHKKTTLAIPHEEAIAADDMFYFDGANGNRLYVVPSKELVIVRTGGFNLEWEESFIPNTLIRGIIDRPIPVDQQTGSLPPIPADDDLFWWRWNNLPKDIFEPEMDWYRPTEKIVGAETGPSFEAANLGVLKETTIKEIESYAQNHNSTALVVLHKGKIALETYWNGYSRDKLFSSHSMNKTITGLAVGLALDDGLIKSLDDEVKDYLPRAEGTPYGGRTIRSLLHMSAGAEDLPFDFQPNTRAIQLSYGTDAIGTALSYQLPAAPETEFNHENSAPLLLGAIVASATGKRYADYMSDRFWKPLGLRSATLYLDSEGGTPHTDCCLLTYPTDWLLVGELLRNKGKLGNQQIISETYLNEMLTPSPANPNYGFMIWLGNEFVEKRVYREGMQTWNTHSEPFAADDVFFLDGYGNKRVWIVPSKELVIMRLGFIDKEFDEAFIPNAVIEGLAAE